MVNAGGQAYTQLTVRDYFAGQALAGLCARQSFTYGSDAPLPVLERVGEWCYAAADAMLAERDKE